MNLTIRKMHPNEYPLLGDFFISGNLSARHNKLSTEINYQ